MNPTTNMMGTTHQVSIAPPVRRKSAKFMATSIEIIEIKLIPSAVFKAWPNVKDCLNKMIVSRVMLVSKPLIIAKIIMAKVDQGIPVI
tara:strand:- start:526 stop:789 length:264 start_codon:yes stop_codon:yes gene_type:complete